MSLIDESGAKAIQGWLPKRNFDPFDVIVEKDSQMVMLTVRNEHEFAVLKQLALQSRATVDPLVPVK